MPYFPKAVALFRSAFLFLFIMVAALSRAASFYGPAIDSEEWNDWLKLMHFRDGKSMMDGPGYFFSKNGKRDPLGEWAASIEAFKNRSTEPYGKFKYPLQCNFPERFRFLKAYGHLVGVKKIECPEFDEWKAGLGAQSVSLVYSAMYFNNPASLFGHTFIRLNRANKRNDLLDYTVTFVANVDPKHKAPTFMWNGLLGNYESMVQIRPYYLNVQEYNDAESRDLFEYELGIDQKNVERLVSHIWEIHNTSYFDYYFVDDNCSTMVASVLEVVSDWKLSQSGTFYYQPIDTIKILKRNQGAVIKEKYRPSNFSNLMEFHHRDDKSEAFLIDREIEILSFKRIQQAQNFKDEKKFKELLRKRAKLDAPSVELGLRPPYDPADAPPSRKLGLFSSERAHGLQISPGVHDLFAKGGGMPPWVQLNFLEAEAAYIKNEEKFTIHKFLLADVRSMFPRTSFYNEFSWRVKVDYAPIEGHTPCPYCRRFNAEGGMGMAWSFWKEAKGRLFSYLGPHIQWASALENHVRGGVFGELGVAINPLDWIKLGTLAQYKQLMNGKPLENGFEVIKSNISFFYKNNYELRLEHLLSDDQSIGRVGVNYRY